MNLLAARHLAITVFIAVLSLFPARTHAGDGRPERLVLYVNEGGVRVHHALKQLDEALHRSGVSSRHRVRLHHLVVDLWKPDTIKAGLQEGLQLHPAAIIATNSDIAAIAKSLTTQVPVIFGSHQDPIRLGLVESLARPGGNLTGFTYFVPVDAKRIELLRQLAPNARSLGILTDRWWLHDGGGMDAANQAKTALGFEPHFFEVETLDDLRKTLLTPAARGIDAWYIPNTVLAYYQPLPLVEAFAALHRPAMFPSTQFVDRGALVSYQQIFTLQDATNLLATMVGRILDGLPPGEIPIERPKSFELAINVAAARRLGITIPASLIRRADRVFDDKTRTAGAANR